MDRRATARAPRGVHGKVPTKALRGPISVNLGFEVRPGKRIHVHANQAIYLQILRENTAPNFH